MCRRFFAANVRWSRIATARGPVAAPRLMLPVCFSVGGGRFGSPIQTQWDTGAQVSVMSEALARGLGIDLEREPDTRMRGVTGVEVSAWYVTRYARFPELCGWQFKLNFLVHRGSADPLPLLGMLDTYENFEVHSRGDDYFFFLKDGHRGEPIPPAPDCAP
jgi:hypothetical protein